MHSQSNGFCYFLFPLQEYNYDNTKSSKLVASQEVAIIKLGSYKQLIASRISYIQVATCYRTIKQLKPIWCHFTKKALISLFSLIASNNYATSDYYFDHCDNNSISQTASRYVLLVSPHTHTLAVNNRLFLSLIAENQEEEAEKIKHFCYNYLKGQRVYQHT